MARLIDADSYIEEYQVAADIARKNGGKEMNLLADFYCEVIKEVKKRPTVDAVEVVRCKDCKRWKRVYGDSGTCDLHELNPAIYAINSDGFCSYGERKDNGL